ncbi:MAG: MauE/DoxX family redox-associated membrane protein [Acidimicrobiales bacterium]
MSAPPTTALYLAAAVLLGVAGCAKAARPDGTARALHAAGIKASRSLVRTGAAAEVALCVAAFVAPGPVTGGLVAASYAGFALFVATALRRGWALSSCGCFGRPDSPPTVAHAGVDVAACAAAVWWACVPPASIGGAFAHQPWHGGPLAFVIAVLAGLALVVWTNPLAAVRR